MNTARQHLLYLHTRGPSITAPVIGMAEHRPVTGGRDTIRTRDEWPYATVHDAIVDGWQVIQFPVLQAPVDDREIDYVGFEFILQKIAEAGATGTAGAAAGRAASGAQGATE